MIDSMYRKDLHDLEIETDIMILPNSDVKHVTPHSMTLPEPRLSARAPNL
jgi:hypothetical protein